MAGRVCVYIYTGIFTGIGMYLVWCGGFFLIFFFFFVLPASVDLTETPCPTTILERPLQNGFENVLVCLGVGGGYRANDLAGRMPINTRNNQTKVGQKP